MSDDADRAGEQIERWDEQRRANLAHPRNYPAVCTEDGVRVCCECGDPIPTERIGALPHVVLCVTCQQDAELRGRS